MEVNEQNLSFLKTVLQNAMSADNATRKGAESTLEQHECSPGFPLLVLTLVSRDGATPQDTVIRQSAAVLFKNIVKRRWVSEDDDKISISHSDKELIKNNVIELMTSAPTDVQRQLVEAVSIIAKHDFPHQWQNLLPQLVQNLNKGDILVNRGVMLTANSIMKRFRDVFKSDELFTVILFCLREFAQPLLKQFQQNSELIQRYNGSIRELVVVMETQRLIARIFYSLNWQDIPEVFEDNVDAWMTEFAKYLTYVNPILLDNDEEQESGPIERLQAAILDNISLYATKYEESFEKYLPQFTQLVWKLLIEVDSKPKYDILATSAIKFLTSVASQQHNVGLFNEQVLQNIVDQIVVKNLTATEADEESFDDNATDYIRKDFEGVDVDSRRRCAIDLIRTLLRFFAPQITPMCLNYMHNLLQTYANSQGRDWRSKDTALHLLYAVSVSSGTMTSGCATVNSLVEVLPLFTQHVLSELHESSIDRNAIVKADAIKLVCFFRTQWPAQSLLSLLPQIVRFLQSKHVVLQTYAAICVEKFLSLKDRDAQGVSVPRLSKAELVPHFQSILSGLFAVLENPSLSENEHVMKCIMRVLVVIGDDINGVLELVLSHLVRALEKVCKNPVQPHYNHYLFECLALAVGAACGNGSPSAVNDRTMANCATFETLLFPLFQVILAQDIAEFVPYVFQILAQLLTARPQASGLSDAYRSLFGPLLSPSLWERKGNVIALVDLFKAYLSRGMREIVAANQITGVLGVFQKLLSSRSSEGSAMQLLCTIYSCGTVNELQGFFPTIFSLLLQRLQDAVKSTKCVPFAKLLLHNFCVFVSCFGAQTLFDTLEKITPGLVSMLIVNIWSANRDYWPMNEAELKQVVVGGTKLLVESSVVTQPEVWASLFASVQIISVQKPVKRPELSMDDETAEDRAFDSTYSKLVYANVPSIDCCADVANGIAFMASQVAAFTRSRPGQFAQFVAAAAAVNAEASAAFQAVLHQNGLSIA